MKKIGLISDTHSHFDPLVKKYFAEVDEIWHAGDIGDFKVIDELEQIAPVKAVYGNIDHGALRHTYPLNLYFDVNGLKVFMTHIGGYPGRYTKRVRALLDKLKPDLYICGHSHIVKIMPDKKRTLLHINPGAAGVHGFHKVKTIVRFAIADGKIQDLELVELGKRGKIR